MLMGLVLQGCVTTLPSATFQHDVPLPVPASAILLPESSRLTDIDQGERYALTARKLIPIAFDFQPDIKSSFQRFKSEEARYDFFFSSRDSLTPRLVTSNSFSDERAAETVIRRRDHTVELSVEKRFFDTSRMDVGVGYRTVETENDIGNTPFISTNIRYPFSASREKLERTSEDIFRRNELDDVQLGYIQQIRRRLQNALFRYYEVAHLQRQVTFQQEWLEDLKQLAKKMDQMNNRDITSDRSRLEAEIAGVNAELRNTGGRYQVQMTRLKAACGIPFHAQIEMVDEPFNPFVGQTHQDLLRASIATDPEIATLKNSVRNAEVQLDLARRGRWDIALLINADSNLEGRGNTNGISDWNVSVGLDVSMVDPRVTDSLSRQAEASISRFQQAIAAREDNIFANTFEPLIRIQTLSVSREELTGNLPRYKQDYQTGVTEYIANTLNIDDLITRRETLVEQQIEISSLTFLVGANVAELCSATGKFFELLNGSDGS